MVVLFSRASSRLNVHIVSVSLLARFGGYAQGFRVRLLKDRSYKFLVASKAVGFEIYNAGKIVEKDFELVFNLWNYGGPNWQREEALYYAELDNEWTLVGRSDKAIVPNFGDHRSYSAVVRDGKSVFERLSGPIHEGSNQGLNSNSLQLNPVQVRPQMERQVVQRSFARNHVVCHACEANGHMARFCTTPNLPGLWPFIHFDSFPSPPEEA